jgi:hypothetical protein
MISCFQFIKSLLHLTSINFVCKNVISSGHQITTVCIHNAQKKMDVSPDYHIYNRSYNAMQI